ncbi:class I SAM-dependent methyltransferase [Chloroflexota bacterium]
MNTAKVYSTKAEKYAKYRWDYAPQAIEIVFDVAQISDESAVADIGAGTGILAKHFGGRVKHIFAVEINLEMRQMATKALAQYPSFRSIDGRAEATTLPDDSVDLITVAQAIHWFEPESTKLEFCRILKPAGWLAVLQNYGTDEEVHKVLAEEVFTEENGVDTAHTDKMPTKKPMRFYYDGNDFLHQTFSFTSQRTWEEFMGSLASTSYVPDEDGFLYANFERAAKRVFEHFSVDGLLTDHGATELYLGQMKKS